MRSALKIECFVAKKASDNISSAIAGLVASGRQAERRSFVLPKRAISCRLFKLHNLQKQSAFSHVSWIALVLLFRFLLYGTMMSEQDDSCWVSFCFCFSNILFELLFLQHLLRVD